MNARVRLARRKNGLLQDVSCTGEEGEWGKKEKGRDKGEEEEGEGYCGVQHHTCCRAIQTYISSVRPYSPPHLE